MEARKTAAFMFVDVVRMAGEGCSLYLAFIFVCKAK